MSDLSLPTDCQALSARIRVLEGQIETANLELIAWINYIEKGEARPGGIPLPGSPESNLTKEQRRDFAQKKLKGLQDLLGKLNTQLNSAIAQFNFTKCNKPDIESCEKKTTGRLVGDGSSMPKQIRDASKLRERVAALTQDFTAIQQAKLCLDSKASVCDSCSIPQFDENSNWDALIPGEIQPGGVVANDLRDSPCLNNEDRVKLAEILNKQNSWRFNPAIQNMNLTAKAQNAIKAIFRAMKKRVKEELDIMEKKWIETQKRIASLEERIAAYEDENSAINNELRETIRTLISNLLIENLDKLEYTVVTTISATAGPGSPPGTQGYSITLTGDKSCVTREKNKMILDSAKALSALGPGGCALLSDAGEIETDGVVYPTGPAWLEPVNITSVITISNDTTIEADVMNGFQTWVGENRIILDLVTYEGTTAGRKPVLDIVNSLTLSDCISAPLAE